MDEKCHGETMVLQQLRGDPRSIAA